MYTYVLGCFFSFLSENLTEKIFFLISHREKKNFLILAPLVFREGKWDVFLK